MVKQISNRQVMKKISEEMIDLEAKIAKWNPKKDKPHMIDKWIDREEELICFRLEVIDAIRGN